MDLVVRLVCQCWGRGLSARSLVLPHTLRSSVFVLPCPSVLSVNCLFVIGCVDCLEGKLNLQMEVAECLKGTPVGRLVKLPFFPRLLSNMVAPVATVMDMRSCQVPIIRKELRPTFVVQGVREKFGMWCWRNPTRYVKLINGLDFFLSYTDPAPARSRTHFRRKEGERWPEVCCSCECATEEGLGGWDHWAVMIAKSKKSTGAAKIKIAANMSNDEIARTSYRRVCSDKRLSKRVRRVIIQGARLCSECQIMLTSLCGGLEQFEDLRTWFLDLIPVPRSLAEIVLLFLWGTSAIFEAIALSDSGADLVVC
jgi:hypothetical protein